jgi:hypothetical protein
MLWTLLVLQTVVCFLVEVSPGISIECKENDSSVLFEMKANTAGWVALGWNDKPLMTGAHSVIGWHSREFSHISYREITAYQSPSPDSKSAITNGSVQEGDGITTLKFAVNYGNLLERNKNYYLVWAVGDIDGDQSSLMISKHTRKGTLLVRIPTGVVTSGWFTVTNAKKLHGLFMGLSWGLLIPLGTYVAAFVKGSNSKFLEKKWFAIHIITQSLGLLFSLAGFALIVWHYGHIKSGIHHYLGLSIIVLSIFQVLLGIIAHWRYDPNRKSTPLFPDRVHNINGHVCFLLGLLNCGLGISAMDIPRGPFDFFIVASSLFILLPYAISGYRRYHQATTPKNYDAGFYFMLVRIVSCRLEV